MVFKKLVVGPLGANCYILAPKPGGDAVVIDPGGEANKIMKELEADKLTLRYIINTHAHFDHVGANYKLREVTGAKVAIHSNERSDRDMSLEEGQLIELAGMKIKVIETPGHSAGHISLLVGNKLFTGDLLFSGSVGRTDLPGGSFDELVSSLKKVLKMPENLVIYPGHGPETTLRQEKETNPYLEEL